MANNTTKTGLSILQPIMQYGFAGMSAVLLGILVWTMHRTDQRFDQVLEMQRETNQVIERNTQVTERTITAIQDLSRLVRDSN